MLELNDYENLVNHVSAELPILEVPISEKYKKEGLYRNGRIYIEKSLPIYKKKEILAEEYGHYKTSVGNIINLNNVESRKQELRARRYGIETIVTLDDLIDCSLAGLHSNYSCAEYLGISEDFLKEVLEHYYKKYGLIYIYKGYIFHFDEYYLKIVNTGLS